MKTCTKCGITKENDEFYKHKRLCKECYALKNKQAYEEKIFVDENSVPVDENKYEEKIFVDKTELTELILNLGKEYDSKVENLTAQFESELEKLADTINNTIDVLQKNIAVLVDTNRIQYNALQEVKKEIVVLRATDVNHQTAISKLMKENESLNERMNEMMDENKTMNIKIDAIYKYIQEKAEYDAKNEKDDTASVKSEKQNSPVRFDVPEDKPVSGSATKKGYPTREDVIYTKNRVMQHMKLEDLKKIAKQLEIKTSKPTGGYKTKDELKSDILTKLESWKDKQ
jgi:hypothetical protein